MVFEIKIKIAIFGPNLPHLPHFWANENFRKKIRLCQFLEILKLYLHAKKTEKTNERFLR